MRSLIRLLLIVTAGSSIEKLRAAMEPGRRDADASAGTRTAARQGWHDVNT
jgi:hypothetical protein